MPAPFPGEDEGGVRAGAPPRLDIDQRVADHEASAEVDRMSAGQAKEKSRLRLAAGARPAVGPGRDARMMGAERVVEHRDPGSAKVARETARGLIGLAERDAPGRHPALIGNEEDGIPEPRHHAKCLHDAREEEGFVESGEGAGVPEEGAVPIQEEGRSPAV